MKHRFSNHPEMPDFCIGSHEIWMNGALVFMGWYLKIFDVYIWIEWDYWWFTSWNSGMISFLVWLCIGTMGRWAGILSSARSMKSFTCKWLIMVDVQLPGYQMIYIYIEREIHIHIYIHVYTYIYNYTYLKMYV